MKQKLLLGVAPTRRNIFSREDAIKHKNIIIAKLREAGIDFIDLEWLNEDGLLYDVYSVDPVYKRFSEAKVDALFVPHCNFGCEEAVANLAKRLAVPVLLWGPRDEAPLEDGLRLRDSQCGLFATSKVLSRMGVTFTYMVNSWVTESEWINGVRQFLRAAAVVKAFKNMKIGQIGTRPRDFFSVIYNESELLEKFGIQVIPCELSEMVGMAKKKLKDKESLAEQVDAMKGQYAFGFSEDYLYKMAAFKLAIREWAEAENLSAVAVQCWNALQDLYGISPCLIHGILTDEGLPVACETDICGAVSSVIAQAAAGDTTPTFFADLTVRHPYDHNTELLWHCGPFPPSLSKDGKTAIGSHYTLPSGCPGVCEWEIRHGDITVLRFDGLNGQYSIFAAKGEGVDGPKCRGTYVWTRFSDWEAIEKKLIYGPYIHHVAGVHGDIIPIVEEALRYLPNIKNDIFKG